LLTSATVPNPQYSVCITHDNEGQKVRASLESLFAEIDGRFEVVVADNLSTDGSEIFLRNLAREGKIRLLERRGSRGLGRNLALENARGRLVVSGIDMDDYVIPGRLSLLLDFYHKECDGSLLKVMESGICLAPRELFVKVGGWRDLQFSENWDVCERAARIGMYRWTIFKVKNEISTEERSSLIKRNRVRYKRYLDELRLRRNPFQLEKRVSVGKMADYLLALLSTLYTGHLNEAPTGFDDVSGTYFVDSSNWWHRMGQDEKDEVDWYTRLLKRVPNWYS